MKNQIQQKIPSSITANARQIAIFVVVVGLLGVILVLSASANVPRIGLDAENLSLTGPAVIADDASASGGQFVEFGPEELTESVPVVAPVTNGPQLWMFSGAVDTTYEDAVNYHNNIAPIQGWVTFDHLGWVHPFTNTKSRVDSFEAAKRDTGVKTFVATTQLGPWSVDLFGGPTFGAEQRQFTTEYFQELDAFLARNPDSNLIIKLMHEMNGAWVENFNGPNTGWYAGPWPETSRAEVYKTAWRRIHAIGESMPNADRIEWLWGPNVWWPNTPSDPSNAYPGNDVVDYVGVSWYPTSVYQIPIRGASEHSLESVIDNLRAIAPGKKVGISEFGVGAVNDRPGYWSEVFNVLDEKNADFVLYFYVRGKEGEEDWTLLSSPLNEIQAYQAGFQRWLID